MSNMRAASRLLRAWFGEGPVLMCVMSLGFWFIAGCQKQPGPTGPTQVSASPTNTTNPAVLAPKEVPHNKTGASNGKIVPGTRPSDGAGKPKGPEKSHAKDPVKAKGPELSQAWSELSTLLLDDWKLRSSGSALALTPKVPGFGLAGVMDAKAAGFDEEKLKRLWQSFKDGKLSANEAQLLATAAFYEASKTIPPFTKNVLVPLGTTAKAMEDTKARLLLSIRLLLFFAAHDALYHGCPKELVSAAWSIHEQDRESESCFRRALLYCLVAWHESSKDKSWTGDLLCAPGSLKTLEEPGVQERMVRRITLARIMRNIGPDEVSVFNKPWERFLSAGETEAALIEELNAIRKQFK